MQIPRYIVIRLDMKDMTTVTATDVTDRCEVYEYEADEDEPQTEDKHAVCTGCDYYDLPNAFHPCASCVDFSKYKPKIEDEPQTERHLPDYSYESGIAERLKQAKKPCGKCEYHDWKWDEHIGFVDICKGIGRCPYNVQETITSEPQTERSSE